MSELPNDIQDKLCTKLAREFNKYCCEDAEWKKGDIYFDNFAKEIIIMYGFYPYSGCGIYEAECLKCKTLLQYYNDNFVQIVNQEICSQSIQQLIQKLEKFEQDGLTLTDALALIRQEFPY